MDKHTENDTEKENGTEFMMTPEEKPIQMPVLDKIITTDVAEDFTLPDYLPEIKRLIRVFPKVVPNSKYIGGNGVEFAGSVNYGVLYCDNDGRLFSTSLYSDYEFECELGDAREAERLSVFADSDPESVSSRLTGPRKINIKCRLRSHVRAFYFAAIHENVEGAENAEDEFTLERLKRTYPAAYIIRSKSDDITLDDALPLDSYSGEITPIYCDGKAYISDVSFSDGAFVCRGDVILTCICEKKERASEDNSAGDGDMSEHDTPCEILTLTKKIPFSESVDSEGADGEFECRAFGRCTAVTASTAEDGSALNFEAVLSLEIEAQKNVAVSVTEDAYSTMHESECTYKTYNIPRALKCTDGSFSLNETVPLDKLNGDAVNRIIEISGTAKAESAEFVKGKYVISGTCSFFALVCTENGENGEINNFNFEIPYKYEIEGENEKIAKWNCDAEVVSARARVEGNNVTVDAEVFVSAALEGTTEVRAAENIKLNKDRPYRTANGNSAFVIYYPTKDDTLWALAKKYHTSAKNVARMNGIENLAGVDILSPASINGTDFLIFEK